MTNPTTYQLRPAATLLRLLHTQMPRRWFDEEVIATYVPNPTQYSMGATPLVVLPAVFDQITSPLVHPFWVWKNDGGLG